MQQDRLNILTALSSEHQVLFKELFLSSVLATDMTKHKDMLDKLCQMLSCKGLVHHELPPAIKEILREKSLDLSMSCKRKVSVECHASSC